MNKKYFYTTIITHLILYLIFVLLNFVFINTIIRLFIEGDYIGRVLSATQLAIYPLIFISAVAGRIMGWRLSKKFSDDKYIKIANVINVASATFIVALAFYLSLATG